MAELTVSGVIRQQDTGAGVHGLTVEAWDDRGCDDRCLGSDLTNRDGSYSIRFCPPDNGCPTGIFLKVRDREGRLIYDARRESCACRPDAPTTINLSLVRDTLWWHLATPTSWEPPTGQLIDPRVVAEVREAITTLLPGSKDRALCAVPPIQLFDGLLRDAWQALQGDLGAARRFRDVLDVLCGDQGCDCEEHSALSEALEDVFRVECPPATPCGDLPAGPQAHGSRCGGGCGCGCDEGHKDPHCPCDDSIVARDDVIVLLTAILHISCGHTPTAIRYAGALLDQICQLRSLGALHAAASRAMFGDQVARDHFHDLVEFLELRCCDNDSRGCTSRNPLRCCATCIDEHIVECLREAICAWQDIECYRITDVQPRRACPGDTIVVCGEGFGEVPGSVVFREYGGIDPGPPATPTKWCCDSFSVVVPQGAGCGMTLVMPPDTVRLCGRFLQYRPFGCAEATFDGTAADILKFNVAGRKDGDCIEPGTPLKISWATCAADHVRVEIVNEATGAVIDALDPAPDRGTWVFDGQGFTTTTRVRVRLIARGICQPPVVERHLSLVYQARPNLTVDGIEVTQAIQHYKSDQHLTDAADRGADNSLRLVIEKTAWVRAYLRSGQDPTFDGGQLNDIDGTLTVERRVGGVWSTVTTINSQNGPVDARDSFVSYDAERGNIDTTLNFVIPAAVMTGLLRLTVSARSPFSCPGNAASRSTTVDVNLRQTLNAAFITIGYDGPDNAGTGTLTLPAPTLADCQAETSWAMTTYPVSGAANVRIAGTFVTETPINDPRSCPGCCSPNWGPLLNEIDDLVTADQALNPGNWAYYGIIANGIPVNVPGCSGAATGGVAGQPATYAHEIGHQFGLAHARCGNAGTGNAAYPVYEPYDLPVDVPANPVNTTNWTMASIGEYGLDINNGNIANPSDCEDFMSYCGPRWVSKFTHDYLINDLRLDPVVVPTGSGAASQRTISDTSAGFEPEDNTVAPRIVLSGLLGPDGTFDVKTVARLATRYYIGTGVPSGYRAQLIGADGTLLADDHVYRYSVEGACGDHRAPCCDDCAEPEGFVFKAMLGDVAPGQCLRIVKRGETVWERTAPKSPPKLSRVRATTTDGGVHISWVASVQGESGSAWIRWADDGETWHALTVGVSKNEVDVPLAQLPSGAVTFQVLLHDGFSTVSATAAAVEIPEQPPAVTILYPRSTDRVYGERQMHLWGSASTPNGTKFADADFTWYIDDKEVGSGADIWVDNPGPGRHTVRLTVADGDRTGTAESTFETQRS